MAQTIDSTKTESTNKKVEKIVPLYSFREVKRSISFNKLVKATHLPKTIIKEYIRFWIAHAENRKISQQYLDSILSFLMFLYDDKIVDPNEIIRYYYKNKDFGIILKIQENKGVISKYKNWLKDDVK